MNILITGGSGAVGRGVVKVLAEHGHNVRSIDRVTLDSLPGVEQAVCDITDFAAVREQMRGMQAVIHLAAHPNPASATGHEIFRVNCHGSYNVYEAAAQEGIRRVSSASSINALGYNFGIRSFPLEAFPIDEDQPSCTTDPYSFSKQTLEAVADYYWRRDGISGVCLRMPGIYTMTPEMIEMGKQYAGALEQAYQGLIAMPEDERRARLARLTARVDQIRANRDYEKPWDPAQNGEYDPMDPDNIIGFGYTEFWTLLSVEDTAQAFEKSVLADYEGSHPLYVCEAENYTGLPSEDLLRVYYPEVTARRRPIVGAGSIVSYDRARALIGFEPEYLIRTRIQ